MGLLCSHSSFQDSVNRAPPFKGLSSKQVREIKQAPFELNIKGWGRNRGM
jgi:hypothetical protein